MKNKLLKVILIFLCAFLGFAGGHMAQKLSFTYSMSPLHIFSASMGFILLSFLIHIIMHEVGHLIFGLVSGYHFILIRFFSLTLVQTDKGFKLKRFKVPGTGGQCLMSPPKSMHEPFPTQLYNYGGIIMNAVLALVALVILIIGSTGPYMQIFLTLLILLGIFSILVNGLVMEDTPNDGYNAALLRNRPELLPYFWLQLYVVGMKAQGKGYEAINSKMIQPVSKQNCDNVIGLTAQLIYIESLPLNRDRLEAYEALEGIEMIPLQRVLVDLDHASCLMMEGEVIEPTPLMNNIAKKLKGNPDCLKYEYLKARIIDQDMERAEQIYNSFFKATKHYPYRKDVELIYKELKSIHESHLNG